MGNSPNYGFYKEPRFSANHLAEYLCTRDASQRESVIRRAKFPRKPALIAYQQVTPILRGHMSANHKDIAEIDIAIERMARKAERDGGYSRDEALRCIAALEAFKEAIAEVDLGKAQFSHGPQDLLLTVSDLRVNVRLDPTIVEVVGEQMHHGGCVIFLASSKETRKNIEERRRYVAALVHWALEESVGNSEPLARLCFVLDVFGREAIRAPAANERLRKTVTASCREIVNNWAAVTPPNGYDGPNWH
jgi:hypothetical protein